MIQYVYSQTDAFVVLPDGGTVVLRKGEHWPVDDPVVSLHPELFSAEGNDSAQSSVTAVNADGMTVEQATAAPGEMRHAPRRDARR